MKRIQAVLIAVALAAVTGCAALRKPAEIPVPPAASPTAPAGSVTMPVFFEEGLSQRLVPEPRQFPEVGADSLANMVVKELIAGPSSPYLRRPFEPGLDLAEPVQIKDGIAHVSLNRWFTEGERSDFGAWQAVTAFVLSLTEIPGIQQVALKVGDTQKVSDSDRPLLPGEVVPTPERIRYLQDRVAKGFDLWRRDPAQALVWEGRTFGFTAEELSAAKLAVMGDQAVASGLVREGQRYTISLVRHEGGIWLVHDCQSEVTAK